MDTDKIGPLEELNLPNIPSVLESKRQEGYTHYAWGKGETIYDKVFDDNSTTEAIILFFHRDGHIATLERWSGFDGVRGIGESKDPKEERFPSLQKLQVYLDKWKITVNEKRELPPPA